MYLIIKNKKIEIKECNHFFSKLKGFMFKKNINYGLRFKNCSSIHTFFMFENIDVIMTDKNNKVIKVYNNFKKNKIILPKTSVYYTYELPNNHNSYGIGDILKLLD